MSNCSKKNVVRLDESIVEPEWSRKDFEFGCKLGNGMYGSVYVVREKRTGHHLQFALKRIKKAKLINDHEKVMLKREIEIHSSLSHPNIIRFHGWFYDSNNIYIIQELGIDNLIDVINETKKGLSQQKAARYATHVTKALIYLHSKQIVHRDLKPENILIGINDEAKLTDFGWAKQIKKDLMILDCIGYTQAGTQAYLCPEMLNEKHHGFKVDNWCLGVLIYEMNFLVQPFDNSDRVRNTYTYPTEPSESCRKLIDSLLKVDPNERLELDDVLESEWIQQNADQNDTYERIFRSQMEFERRN